MVRGTQECVVTERETLHIDATGTEWLELPWPTAFELALLLPQYSWTLVGGLMVAMHAHVAGLQMPRTTTDVDSTLHLENGAITFAQTAATLNSAGYVLDEGTKHAYLFTRVNVIHGGQDRIDVMCADRYLAFKKPQYRGRPLFGVAGATRALKETLNIEVETQEGMRTLVIPNIRGALVLKGAAYMEDSRVRFRHAQDAVVLFACVTDTQSLLNGFSATSRKRVRALVEVLTTSEEPWINQDSLVQSLAREALEEIKPFL